MMLPRTSSSQLIGRSNLHKAQLHACVKRQSPAQVRGTALVRTATSEAHTVEHDEAAAVDSSHDHDGREDAPSTSNKVRSAAVHLLA